jgi:hypothetical protein
MCRAAAPEVKNAVLAAVMTGRMESSTAISARSVPWTSPCEIRLKETSTLPALAATASAYPSTAASSRAFTSAVSTNPPTACISAATASSLARVRPARKTLSPSRAKARAFASYGPSAPVDHGVFAFKQHLYPRRYVRARRSQATEVGYGTRTAFETGSRDDACGLRRL